MESKLRLNQCKFINFKKFYSSQNTIYKDKKYMYHLYLHRIMIFKREKTWGELKIIFLDAESKTEFAITSLNLPKTGKLFKGVNLGPRYY